MKLQVELFKNKQTSLIFMLPMTLKPNGVSISINKPAIIESPYNEQIIGENLKLCHDIIMNKRYEEHELGGLIINEVSGIQSFSKFSKLYQSVSSVYDPENGYGFYSLISRNGGYDFPRTFTLELQGSANEEEIGAAILQAFEQCK